MVLDTLAPDERLAFVLHDIFDVPFDEIAPMVARTVPAARQLASRARRRVRAAGVPAPDTNLAAQRAVVDAFFAAARAGDFSKLVALLHPHVVLRADGGAARPGARVVVRGAVAVARQALTGAAPAAHVHPVLVNGAAGVVITVKGRPVTVMGFTVTGGRITEIDGITDPQRLKQLHLGTHVPLAKALPSSADRSR